MINWWAVTVLGIWVCAAIGSFAVKDYSPFVCAIFGTIVIVLAYLTLHGF